VRSARVNDFEMVCALCAFGWGVRESLSGETLN